MNSHREFMARAHKARMKQIKRTNNSVILGTVALLATIVVLVFACANFSSTPIVQWSTSQDKCVAVITYDGEIETISGCENIPEKYRKEPVK